MSPGQKNRDCDRGIDGHSAFEKEIGGLVCVSNREPPYANRHNPAMMSE